MIHSVMLEDNRARLFPLTLENYTDLEPIAFQRGLVAFSPAFIETAEAFRQYVFQAIEQQQAGLSIPLIIYDKKTTSFAGSTRFMNIDRPNKVLHIGATWMGREFHGSGLNTHVKFLMLHHAFEVMGFEKVEFRIDERNIRSRRAVEKLGAVHEGILRKNVYLSDGFKRNTCCYGILLEEWASIKIELRVKLKL